MNGKTQCWMKKSWEYTRTYFLCVYTSVARIWNLRSSNNPVFNAHILKSIEKVGSTSICSTKLPGSVATGLVAPAGLKLHHHVGYGNFILKDSRLTLRGNNVESAIVIMVSKVENRSKTTVGGWLETSMAWPLISDLRWTCLINTLVTFHSGEPQVSRIPQPRNIMGSRVYSRHDQRISLTDWDEFSDTSDPKLMLTDLVVRFLKIKKRYSNMNGLKRVYLLTLAN